VGVEKPNRPLELSESFLLSKPNAGVATTSAKVLLTLLSDAAAAPQELWVMSKVWMISNTCCAASSSVLALGRVGTGDIDPELSLPASGNARFPGSNLDGDGDEEVSGGGDVESENLASKSSSSLPLEVPLEVPLEAPPLKILLMEERVSSCSIGSS
jgi:hypothetical protein